MLEAVIRKLKKNPDYKWESKYTFRDLCVVASARFIQLMRGLWLKLFLKKSKGLLFAGTKVKVKCAYKVKAGSNLILDDYVFINAISEEGINIGNNVSIGRNSTLIGSHVIAHKGIGITIGDGTGINANAYFGGQGGINIGKNVIVGPGVKIFSENHVFADLDMPIKDQGVSRARVSIGDNCWIGSGVTILAGVTIGSGCVIAAGSVINKSMPENVVIGGIPGKILKNRF